MNDLHAPRIPYLSDAQLLVRQRHLVSEVAATRRRRRQRTALAGGGVAAVLMAAAIVPVALGARPTTLRLASYDLRLPSSYRQGTIANPAPSCDGTLLLFGEWPPLFAPASTGPAPAIVGIPAGTAPIASAASRHGGCIAMMVGPMHPVTAYPILAVTPVRGVVIDRHLGWVGVWNGLVPGTGVVAQRLIEPAGSHAVPCLEPVEQGSWPASEWLLRPSGTCAPTGGREVQLDLQMPVTGHPGEVRDLLISTTRLTEQQLVSIVREGLTTN